jgi:hypothetical protein
MLSMEIISDLSSIVQLECAQTHIRLSSQDLFKSSQLEFLMDEITWIGEETLHYSITHFQSDKMKPIIKQLKMKFKTKETKEQYEFWILQLDLDSSELRLCLDEDIRLESIGISTSYHPYDTNLHSEANYIFEIKTSDFLRVLLYMCLGNGYFSITFDKFKNASSSSSSSSSLPALKRKTLSKTNNIEKDSSYKIICKTSSESGKIDVIMNAIIRKLPTIKETSSLFLQTKTVKSEHDFERKEAEEEQKTNYFAVKFTKHFITSLQHEQQQCLLYFVTDQNRCVIEPKGSPFRLILFSQPEERVLHSI